MAVVWGWCWPWPQCPCDRGSQSYKEEATGVKLQACPGRAAAVLCMPRQTSTILAWTSLPHEEQKCYCTKKRIAHSLFLFSSDLSPNLACRKVSDEGLQMEVFLWNKWFRGTDLLPLVCEHSLQTPVPTLAHTCLYSPPEGTKNRHATCMIRTWCGQTVKSCCVA